MEVMALLLFGAVLYFIPTAIALVRGCRQIGGIIVINLFLGWTLIGWVGALVWAAVGKSGLWPANVWSADYWSTKNLPAILLVLLSHGPLAAQGAWTYESGTGGGSVYTEPAGGGSMLLVSCVGNRPVVMFHTGGIHDRRSTRPSSCHVPGRSEHRRRTSIVVCAGRWLHGHHAELAGRIIP